MIVVTDESGERNDNESQLEQALAEAKAARCKIYVLGREAVFGYPVRSHAVGSSADEARPLAADGPRPGNGLRRATADRRLPPPVRRPSQRLRAVRVQPAGARNGRHLLHAAEPGDEPGPRREARLRHGGALFSRLADASRGESRHRQIADADDARKGHLRPEPVQPGRAADRSRCGSNSRRLRHARAADQAGGGQVDRLFGVPGQSRDDRRQDAERPQDTKPRRGGRPTTTCSTPSSSPIRRGCTSTPPSSISSGRTWKRTSRIRRTRRTPSSRRQDEAGGRFQVAQLDPRRVAHPHAGQDDHRRQDSAVRRAGDRAVQGSDRQPSRHARGRRGPTTS